MFLPIFFGIWLCVIATRYSIKEKAKKLKTDPTKPLTTFERCFLRCCCCCIKEAASRDQLGQPLLPSDDETSISAEEIACEAAEDGLGGLLDPPLRELPRTKQLAALQHLEAAIRDCSDLHDFAILIEAYSPNFVCESMP